MESLGFDCNSPLGSDTLLSAKFDSGGIGLAQFEFELLCSDDWAPLLFVDPDFASKNVLLIYYCSFCSKNLANCSNFTSSHSLEKSPSHAVNDLRVGICDKAELNQKHCRQNESN